MNGQEYYEKYKKEMDLYSDEKLIEIFNQQVGVKAWGTARASYLSAVSEQLSKRDFDSSAINNEESTSWRCKIKLENNIIVVLG